MKKLTKRNSVSFNKVEAYWSNDCSCSCICACGLTTLPSSTAKSNAKSNNYSSTKKRKES